MSTYGTTVLRSAQLRHPLKNVRWEQSEHSLTIVIDKEELTLSLGTIDLNDVIEVEGTGCLLKFRILAVKDIGPKIECWCVNV